MLALPISMSMIWNHEFQAKNRIGDSGLPAMLFAAFAVGARGGLAIHHEFRCRGARRFGDSPRILLSGRTAVWRFINSWRWPRTRATAPPGEAWALLERPPVPSEIRRNLDGCCRARCTASIARGLNADGCCAIFRKRGGDRRRISDAGTLPIQDLQPCCWIHCSANSLAVSSSFDRTGDLSVTTATPPSQTFVHRGQQTSWTSRNTVTVVAPCPLPPWQETKNRTPARRGARPRAIEYPLGESNPCCRTENPES